MFEDGKNKLKNKKNHPMKNIYVWLVDNINKMWWKVYIFVRKVMNLNQKHPSYIILKVF